MFRIAALVLFSYVIAIGGGAWSAWWAIERVDGLGALEIGAWTAYPDTGTARTDPYSAARAAREAELPLGIAEGIEFLARRDSQGAALDARCDYRIEGRPPAARFWTLHATDLRHRPLAPRGRLEGLHSHAMLRHENGEVTISIGARPAPGNWLAVPAPGRFILVLSLFDTPLATASRVEQIELPRIVRTGCDV